LSDQYGAADDGGSIGFSVALDGDFAMAGAPSGGLYGSGTAYGYHLNNGCKLLLEAGPMIEGVDVDLMVSGGANGQVCAIVYGAPHGFTYINGGGYCVHFGIDGITGSSLIDEGTFDANGEFTVMDWDHGLDAETRVLIQAARKSSCAGLPECKSNVIDLVVQ
jgi:hypothetical protein